MDDVSSKLALDSPKNFCEDGIRGSFTNFACFYRTALGSKDKSKDGEINANSCVDIFVQKKLVKTLELDELAYNVNYVPIESGPEIQRSVLGFTKVDKSMKAPLV